MMKKNQNLMLLLTCCLGMLMGCNKGEGVNIFTIEDDKSLGLQVRDEIASKPKEYPVLDKTTYAGAYAYLENMKTVILNSGQVTHKDDFAWELFIIQDDNTQNAFCTPGGYIYIYTGLIKYLDNASALAGVMGHEMGHADKRHSTEAMTKQYGISTLAQVVLGKNQGMLSDIALSLVNLQFSRSNESEADKYSVIYLCPTLYKSNGAAAFFNKIIANGSAQPPAFLSTHPNPENRVENIDQEAISRACAGGFITAAEDTTAYNAFKSLLP